MALRIGLILLILVAVFLGLRAISSGPGGHAAELLEQLPDEPGDGQIGGGPPGGELLGFPTTFPADLPVPKPDMSPDEAVRTIMAALRDNDRPTPQSGIATTFNFASPGNKLATGPLPRFAAMVHAPAYAPLINHTTSRVSPPQITDNIAVLRVDITDRAGTRWAYAWQLSKQPDGTWMTDAVQPIDPGPPPSLPPNPTEDEKAPKAGT